MPLRHFFLYLCAALLAALSSSPCCRADDLLSRHGIVPLFGADTDREPATTIDTREALITRVADRARDRHAREAEFQAYDHYLSWYWQERTVAIELVDRVAKGGKGITVNITSLAPLNAPDFRCFFRGINTSAEYFHNVSATRTGPNKYSTTITFNAREGRPLQLGDRMEYEFSQFLRKPENGRSNYYGTSTLYIVGKGIEPWYGTGENRDSIPLPDSARLGGQTTLPFQYSNEPAERFKQMAGNMAPASAQLFMNGRRLHHTDFGSGKHSEQPNPDFDEQRGKLGPGFVARSCIACHVNNGRALSPDVGEPMFQTVVKTGGLPNGHPHPQLGSALQPRHIAGEHEGRVTIQEYKFTEGTYADGTVYTLRRPVYRFEGVTPEFHSVRLTPQLVGLGLLEAVSERTIIGLADPDDKNRDDVSGRVQIVKDPETGQPRLGRFGYKAGQARLRHQIAGAWNSDMGVTTSIFPACDGEDETALPEINDQSLQRLTRYISTLGVSARRDFSSDTALHGEKLFTRIGCAKCHVTDMKTSSDAPLAELRDQTIRPFTDLLLHDMGPGLSDTMGEHEATGAEWRTAPLWSVGLTKGISGGGAYLHDGRARTLAEAILWHGGEGASAKERFRTLTKKERADLLDFLHSL